MSTPSKLHALTSLRFFAAAMLVILHSAISFGFNFTFKIAVLSQGVSFFFVLSGFILAYVYPILSDWKTVQKFWLARWARIWPGHLFTFLLVLLLLPLAEWAPSGNNKTLAALTNLLMVHAWVPSSISLSYNIPSWSISTEFFFYLLFPLLLSKLRKTWLAQLFITGALAGICIYLANHADSYVQAYSLAYESPIARLLEFTLGMTIAFAWRQTKEKINISTAKGTWLEIIALLSVIISMMCYSTLFVYLYHHLHIQKNFAGHGILIWLAHSGSALFFGLLIFVLALEKGIIARILSAPFLVLLGEISFSIYLLHYVLLKYYQLHPSLFANIPLSLAYAGYWIILLTGSWAIWRFFELPCRRFIIEVSFSPPFLKGADARSLQRGDF